MKILQKLTHAWTLLIVVGAFSMLQATLTEIDSLEENFAFVSKHQNLEGEFTKSQYTRNSDGSTWFISNEFNAQQFRYVIANEFYAFFLGEQYLSELAIIKDQHGKPCLGVKFLEGFQNLIDFFHGDTKLEIKMTLKFAAGISLTPKENNYRLTQHQVVQDLRNCFPAGCALTDVNSNTTRNVTLHKAELLLCLMLLIGDMDGNQFNIGFIPASECYVVTKLTDYVTTSLSFRSIAV